MVGGRQQWQGKRVFLTGHTGFKGSWLSLWLQAMGAEVLGYSLAPATQPNIFEAAGVARGMRSILGDIRNPQALTAAVAGFRPEVVFHLAAQSLVRPSYADPAGTYATNVMGTVHVLEAIRSVGGVRAVVVVTSDKCYQNNEWLWGYRESDPMGGYDPYSNSKGCAELVTSAYRQSFFNPAAYGAHQVALASARAGNVIGGGDWATDRLVPDFIRAISKGEAVRIRNPGAIRPWQHVLEPLGGYLRLAERLLGSHGADYASGWNFGPRETDSIPVAELARKLTARWSDGASFAVEADPQQPHEATYLKLDCSKAHALLDWRPRVDVDLAIDWTVGWHKAQSAGRDMRAFSESQIGQFDALAATQ
jgi:CDP-glucose 4,6-dehydratase